MFKPLDGLIIFRTNWLDINTLRKFCLRTEGSVVFSVKR